ncbi:MAG: aspartate/glutamate racemase family protein [Neorhizobium sp.]|nr:aspartate/glutamate racemase family protein [Neorhizobium sp.]
MTHITLINPNSSRSTTAMMAQIATKYLPAEMSIDGMTATRSPAMIIDDVALAAAADEVVEMAMTVRERSAGIIVGAFGDPGLDRIRDEAGLLAVGICEASMLVGGEGGRRFGIATVTPGLLASFAAKADVYGVGNLFTGTRLTDGDPLVIAADPEKLRCELANAVRSCIEEDGAEAVIIGGGPLGQAAEALQGQFSVPIIAPIRAAAELLVRRIAGRS